MLMGSEVTIGWTWSPPLFLAKLMHHVQLTFCCHAPLQATYCSLLWAVITWYNTSVDAMRTTGNSVASSQWQRQKPLYSLGQKKEWPMFSSQSSWCSVHNCFTVTVEHQVMTTTFSLTIRPIKSSVPLNRIAAAMPKQNKLCTNLTGTLSLCNVWNTHVPDGLLWQQPNSSFLSTMTQNSSADPTHLPKSNACCTHCTTTFVITHNVAIVESSWTTRITENT